MLVLWEPVGEIFIILVSQDTVIPHAGTMGAGHWTLSLRVDYPSIYVPVPVAAVLVELHVPCCRWDAFWALTSTGWRGLVWYTCFTCGGELWTNIHLSFSLWYQHWFPSLHGVSCFTFKGQFQKSEGL